MTSPRTVRRPAHDLAATSPANLADLAAANPQHHPARSTRKELRTMPTVAWALLTALAFWMLKKIPKAKNKTLKAVLVRAAAVFFMVAGTITAGGVVGSFLSGMVSAANQFGAGLAWILFFVLFLSWVAGIVPEKIFGGDVPDWLSMSGLVLPSLLASVPGPVGRGVSQLMVTMHDTIGTMVGSWFSVNA